MLQTTVTVPEFVAYKFICIVNYRYDGWIPLAKDFVCFVYAGRILAERW
jgi:hypothetical protein